MAFRSIRLAVLAGVVCTVVMAFSPARAGLDISFGANVPIGDDGNLFFSIGSRYFDRDVRVVEDWGRRFPNPDDLAVAMFLDARCGRGPDFFVSLRRQGLGWFEISNRCSVPVDAWFVPVERDPGPPYGNAYGYWRKHQRDPRVKVVLTDADARNLVAVRMAHEYYGVPVSTAMQWRTGGRDVRALMVGEYRTRHGKGGGGDQGRGHGGGKDKRKDRGHGHGNH